MSQLRRPPALVCGSFLLLGAGIVGNALFLQPGRHPAPLFSTRDVNGTPEAQVRDDLVEAIQAALKRTGHYEGPVDGISGPRTIAAIAAYERTIGRVDSGEASFELLAAIRASTTDQPEPGPTMESRSPQAGATEPDERIVLVQGALARAAYGPLRADGAFGPQTRDAILRFQKDHGLPLTGEISDALLVELRAAGAIDGN